MSGRKQYKLEKETYLQVEGKTTFAISSTVFFNIDYQGHLHLLASLLGQMHKSALCFVPLPTQHPLTQGTLVPLLGSSQG